jgi:hypothetical protein
MVDKSVSLFRRYKAKIKLFIMFKDFIYLFQNWKGLKEYPFFGLKLKYAIWIVPIPFVLWSLVFLGGCLAYFGFLNCLPTADATSYSGLSMPKLSDYD